MEIFERDLVQKYLTESLTETFRIRLTIQSLSSIQTGCFQRDASIHTAFIIESGNQMEWPDLTFWTETLIFRVNWNNKSGSTQPTELRRWLEWDQKAFFVFTKRGSFKLENGTHNTQPSRDWFIDSTRGKDRPQRGEKLWPSFMGFYKLDYIIEYSRQALH